MVQRPAVRTVFRGEQAYILRRREGLTQQQAADRDALTLYSYRLKEADRSGTVNIGVHDYEWYCLLRRRQGRKIAAVAYEIGCSQLWLSMMERGQAPIDKLEEYWRARTV